MCRRMTREEIRAGKTQTESPDDCWSGLPGDWWPPLWLIQMDPHTVTCCDEGEA